MRLLPARSRMIDSCLGARRPASVWLVCITLTCATQAQAQQAAPSPPSPPPPAVTAPVTTLDRVQALRPEEEVLDLYTFKNPVAVDPNRFDQAYDPGITPEEMALRYGGYVNYGINQGLLKTWKGIKHVTGMRPYEQPAIARQPPLSEAQMRRAVEGSMPAE
jgi:hypothetical protein